ncbi:MAG: cell wall hydrolase [Paracoccaceae bacterium]
MTDPRPRAVWRLVPTVLCLALLASAARADRDTPEEVGALPDGSLARLIGDERGRVEALLADEPMARAIGLPGEALPDGPRREAAGGERPGPLGDGAEREGGGREDGRLAGRTRSRTVTDLLIADPSGVVDAEALALVEVGERSAEWRCLAEALYFEARGEGLVGQLAVAEVVLNRVDSARYPDGVCAVVTQGAERLHACQFSYMCDGEPETIEDDVAFDRAGKLAWLMLEGRPRTLTGQATHYRARYVSPYWSSAFDRTARIGQHLFYRAAARVGAR